MTKRAAHYNTRVAREICEYIANGLTLKEALARIGFLAPNINTVYKWLELYPEFREKYERARTLQADVHADEVLELSRSVLQNPKDAAAHRVAADILRWQAEIRNRGKYGKTIDESNKNKALDPAKLRAEIKRLETELGVAESKVTPLKAVKTGTKDA